MFAESFPRVLVGGMYPVPHGLVTGTFVICGQAAQSFSGRDFLADHAPLRKGRSNSIWTASGEPRRNLNRLDIEW
jgi:hypothetical protein